MDMTDVLIYQRRQILEQDEPDLADCPCKLHQCRRNDFLNHILRCKELKDPQQATRIYICQFYSLHAFLEKNERNEHEKNCRYYIENQYYQQKKIEWDRENGFQEISADPNVKNSRNNQQNQKIPQHIWKKIQEKQAQKKLQEQQIQQNNNNQQQQQQQQQLINQNPQNEGLQNQAQIPIQNIIQNVVNQNNNKDQFNFLLSDIYKTTILRCDHAIYQQNQQYKQKIFLKNDLQITRKVFLEQDEILLEIQEKIKNQADYMKYMTAEFVFQNKQQQNELLNIFDRYGLGINYSQLLENKTGEILIFFTFQSTYFGKFLKGDCAIMIIQYRKNSYNNSFYLVNQNPDNIKVCNQQELEILKSNNKKDELRKFLFFQERSKHTKQLSELNQLIGDMQKDADNLIRQCKQQKDDYVKEKQNYESKITYIQSQIFEVNQQLEKIRLDKQFIIQKYVQQYDVEKLRLEQEYQSKLHHFNSSVQEDYKVQEFMKKYEQTQIDLRQQQRVQEKLDIDIQTKSEEEQNQKEQIEFLEEQVQDIKDEILIMEYNPEQYKDNNDKFTCKVCKQNNSNVCYLPCGHLMICTNCYQSVQQIVTNQCIFCWTPVKTIAYVVQPKIKQNEIQQQQQKQKQNPNQVNKGNNVQKNNNKTIH